MVYDRHEDSEKAAQAVFRDYLQLGGFCRNFEPDGRLQRFLPCKMGTFFVPLQVGLQQMGLSCKTPSLRVQAKLCIKITLTYVELVRVVPRRFMICSFTDEFLI